MMARYISHLIRNGMTVPALFQWKDPLSRNGNFHYEDKIIVSPSYLYNGNPYPCSSYHDGQVHITSYKKWHDYAALFKWKDHLSRNGDSHYKDKMVMNPSDLYNGTPYSSKTTSLLWDGPLIHFAMIMSTCLKAHYHILSDGLCQNLKAWTLSHQLCY